MTKRSTGSHTASDILREAKGTGGSLSDVMRGTMTDHAQGGFASEAAAMTASKTSAAIEAATGGLRGTAMFRSHTAAEEMQRLMRDGASSPFTGSTAAHDAVQAAAEGRQFGMPKSVVDAATGSLASSVAKTLNDMNGLNGFDTGKIAGISNGFAKLGTASSELEKLINKSDRDLLPGYSARELNITDLPPLPRNPVHRTNELLDTVATELAEQREIIEASATAQQRETELLATLVAAFTNSQIESEKAARRSNRQTWMGLALALLGIVVAVVTALLA